MKKVFEMFAVFFVLVVISLPGYGARPCGNRPSTVRHPCEVMQKAPGIRPPPAYTEVHGYAQNPNVQPLSQGYCDVDGRMGASNRHWCKEYAAKDGNNWRVVFGESYICKGGVCKIIRLADGAEVAFGPLGVEHDSTGVPPPKQVARDAPPSEPTKNEKQESKIDASEIIKKGLGSVIKMW